LFPLSLFLLAVARLFFTVAFFLLAFPSFLFAVALFLLLVLTVDTLLH
jgi:hypothetical protein